MRDGTINLKKALESLREATRFCLYESRGERVGRKNLTSFRISLLKMRFIGGETRNRPTLGGEQDGDSHK